MALNFVAGSDNLVDFGSPADFDNTGGDLTVLLWIRPTSLASDRTFYTKGDDFTDGSIYFRILSTGGDLSLGYARAGSILNVESNTGVVTVNQWHFVGVAINPAGANGDQHMYCGDLTTLVSEVTYATQLVGSGTHDDNTESLGIGNYVPAASWARFDGDIAWVGVWNRQLTEAEIKVQQWRAHPTANCVLFCHLGYFGNGGTNQIDWSGNGNNSSAVTNTTVVPHVPIGPPFGLGLEIADYAIPAAPVLPVPAVTHPRNQLYRWHRV